MYKICVYVPEASVETVKRAMFAAGAGRIGNYASCAWQVKGQGQFEPQAGSTPAMGSHGKLETIDEYRVEMVCADAAVDAVLDALRNAHPYEEPAYQYWPVNRSLD